MKNKLINYLAGIGIPLCALSAGTGCIGVCGNCRLSCAPGILVAIILVCNMLYRKFKARMEKCHG